MIRTEGIILGEIKFKDSSKILTVYTRKHGKISVMAQGAYRPKSQLLATTQPFSYCEFQLRKGRNLYYIQQADLIGSFYSIRENIERITYGFYLLELVEKSTPDEEENEKVFLLLEKGLEVLSKLNDKFLKFIVAYELKFISFLGYRPHLSSCVVCNSELKNNPIKFSRVLGGILCPNCTSNDYLSKNISLEIVKGLEYFMYSALDELDKLEISDHTLDRLHKLLVDYILYNIDTNDFKSLNLINSL